MVALFDSINRLSINANFLSQAALGETTRYSQGSHGTAKLSFWGTSGIIHRINFRTFAREFTVSRAKN